MRRLAIPLVWAATMFATRFVEPLPLVFAVAVGMAALVSWRERSRIAGLLRPTASTLSLGVAAAGAMIAVTYLGFPPVANAFPSIGANAALLYERFLGAGYALPLILAGVIPVVISEEILFRGTVQGETRSMWSVLAAASIYAVAHAPLGSPLLVVVAFICGLYWSALRAMSRSLFPPLCAHLAWDLALILVPPFLTARR